MPYWNEAEACLYSGCDEECELEDCTQEKLKAELKVMAPSERRIVMALENIAFELARLNGMEDSSDLLKGIQKISRVIKGKGFHL